MEIIRNNIYLQPLLIMGLIAIIFGLLYTIGYIHILLMKLPKPWDTISCTVSILTLIYLLLLMFLSIV